MAVPPCSSRAPRDAARDGAGVPAHVEQLPDDRCPVAAEEQPARSRVVRALVDRGVPAVVEDAEMADQLREICSKPGRGDHDLRLDAGAVAEEDVPPLQLPHLGNDLDRACANGVDKAGVEEPRLMTPPCLRLDPVWRALTPARSQVAVYQPQHLLDRQMPHPL